MATIEKRVIAEDLVTWRARVRRQGYPTASKTFNTHAGAERWARQIESEMDRGIFTSREEAEHTALYSALERYGREITPKKRGQYQELRAIARLKDQRIAQFSLAALHSTEIAKFRDELLRRLSPSSVRKYLALISHLYTIARKEWGMGSLVNPVSGVTLPVASNARSRRLEGDEEARLLASAVRFSELPQAITLALETAMRRSEIIGLTWDNVSLVRRVAHLPETKNGSPRDVPLSTRAVETLRQLPRRLDGRVFGTTPGYISIAFERATALAGIKGLTFHDLRHEATSRLAEKFDMHTLMKITGHKDVRMVLRYYHPRAEDLAKQLA
ncbi:MAG: site-specific integrase [Gammaproteobacteria bacterium]